MSALPPKADIARQLASADSTRSCAANATLTRLKSIRLLAELSEKRERSRFVELDAWALVVNAGNLQIESEIDRGSTPATRRTRPRLSLDYPHLYRG